MSTLTLAELDALPAYSMVRFTELHGRPAVAIKRADGTTAWNTSDGTLPNSFWLSTHDAVLLQDVP